MNGSERRQHERRPLIRYIPAAVKGWQDFSVWGHDIGPGGIGLALDHHVSRGDRIIFRLADGTRVEAEVCNVHWKEECGRCWAGLRWLAADDEAKAALTRHLLLETSSTPAGAAGA